MIDGLEYCWTTGEGNWDYISGIGGSSGYSAKHGGLVTKNFELSFVSDPLDPTNVGGGVNLELLDDASHYLRQYFAPRGGYETRATETISATDTSISVLDSSVFAVDEYIFGGRECMKVTAAPDGTTLTVSRAKRGTEAYELRMTNGQVGSILSSVPRVMRGRYAYILAAPVNSDGDIERAALQKIWAGRVAAVKNRGGGRFEVQCDSLSQAFDDYFPHTFASGLLGSPGNEEPVITLSDNSDLLLRWSEGVGGSGEPIGGTSIEPVGITDNVGTWAALSTGSYTLSLLVRAIVDTIIERSVNFSDGDLTWEVWPESTSGVNFWSGRIYNDSATYWIKIQYTGLLSAMSTSVTLGVDEGEALPAGGTISLLTASNVVIGQNDSNLPVYLDDPANSFVEAAYDPGGSYVPRGFAMISDGTDYEVVSFTSVSSNANMQRVISLGGVRRGLFGTWSQKWATSDRQIRITQILAINSPATGIKTNPISVLLQLLTSTGEQGANGAYDTLGYGMGFGIPSSYIDYGSFVAIAEQSNLPQFEGWFLHESGKGKDAISDLLKWMGLTLVAKRYGDDEFGLSVSSIAPATATQYEVAVGDDYRLRGSDVDVDWNERLVINTCAFEPKLNPATGQGDNYKLWVHNSASIADYGAAKELKLGLSAFLAHATSGIELWAEQYQPVAEDAALRWFGAFSRGNYTISMEAPHVGWIIEPGDRCLLTLTGVDSIDGTGDVTGAIAKAFEVTHRHGERAGATIMLRAPMETVCELSPSASVSAYTSGDPSLTLSANVFSASTDPPPFPRRATCKDICWFDHDQHEEDFNVWIYQEGDWDGGEAATVTATDYTNSKLTLDGATATDWQAVITGGDVVLITWDEWDNCSVLSQLYAFVGDNGSAGVPPALGTGSDDAKRWA